MGHVTAVEGAPIDPTSVLPRRRGLYYGGQWHDAGQVFAVSSPGNGQSLGTVADASAADVDLAVKAARVAFPAWRDTAPLERARILRRVAQIVRDNARELALLDALDCGNPAAAMVGDAAIAAAQIDFFAGLVTEMKGASIPMGPDRLNTSVREPLGVVARIVPFNHPFMFAAGKSAAPLAAGNTIIVKPPEQAPLSALRLAELLDGVLPPGVFNVITGSGRTTGEALVAHPGTDSVALIGSVGAGQGVMRTAADRVKPVLLELGGKNALIAFPDADPAAVADAMIAGMNFAWCGQSCGSTSRAFLHADIHDAVLIELQARIGKFRPGRPEDWATTMGAIISAPQHQRILRYIETAKAEGATLLTGGNAPDTEDTRGGLFIEPTVFTGVTQDMIIAREEIFGPVLAVLEWRDEATMLRDVNAVDVGLTCAIWTNDLAAAMRVSANVDVGYVWVNEVSRHFLGAPFGGMKLSGLGREECLAELLSFTREKNIHIRYGCRAI
ncbi:aldehyde dehydrogenase family protein [Paracoccus siganidrum]|uniref:Aldehyde dehydrogenase family protein n=1 Tax=Paracoccus siganidrum TaxID=1276757 RepID=A0A418ZQX5_9RHOB|nr:aldehyde dehydrogenase family protein [Paracoccus siganidrum]RJK98635.1 aldehyde dehydrogenase family protein [Paracoccus siganidrum]